MKKGWKMDGVQGLHWMVGSLGAHLKPEVAVWVDHVALEG